MNFPKVTTKTVHYVNGDELVRWCNRNYDVDIDPVANEEVPGDDSHGFMRLTVTSWSQTLKDMDLKANKEKDRYSVSNRDFIEKALVENGQPEGEYMLEFSWG